MAAVNTHSAILQYQGTEDGRPPGGMVGVQRRRTGGDDGLVTLGQFFFFFRKSVFFFKVRKKKYIYVLRMERETALLKKKTHSCEVCTKKKLQKDK